MKLNLSVKDLFNHMLILGLAQIVEEEMPESSHVTVCWPDPQSAEINWLDGEDLSIEEAAEAVWNFKEKLLTHIKPSEDGVAIDRTIEIKSAKNKSKHSPLSPRIAKKSDFTEAVWNSYFKTRNEILDSMDEVSPLFVKLVRALGFPSYWTEESAVKNYRDNLDISASLWEMAPRNSGSEFFNTKYFSRLASIEQLDSEAICKHIQGTDSDAHGDNRNASGFHCPSPTDSCQAWIAYHGMAMFPARPVTHGSCVSVTQGVLSRGREKRFVLPVPDVPITIDRYAAISRNDSLYTQVANPEPNQHGNLTKARDSSWLVAHGITHIEEFARFRGGSDSCPEYFALEGRISAIK